MGYQCSNPCNGHQSTMLLTSKVTGALGCPPLDGFLMLPKFACSLKDDALFTRRKFSTALRRRRFEEMRCILLSPPLLCIYEGAVMELEYNVTGEVVKSVWELNSAKLNGPFQYKDHFPGKDTGITTVKIRQSRDHLFFIIWIFILVRRHLYMDIY